MLRNYLAHVMRESELFIPELDFVAEADGKIVGNIMYATRWCGGDDKIYPSSLRSVSVCLLIRSRASLQAHPSHARSGEKDGYPPFSFTAILLITPVSDLCLQKLTASKRVGKICRCTAGTGTGKRRDGRHLRQIL